MFAMRGQRSVAKSVIQSCMTKTTLLVRVIASRRVYETYVDNSNPSVDPKNSLLRGRDFDLSLFTITSGLYRDRRSSLLTRRALAASALYCRQPCVTTSAAFKCLSEFSWRRYSFKLFCQFSDMLMSNTTTSTDNVNARYSPFRCIVRVDFRAEFVVCRTDTFIRHIAT